MKPAITPWLIERASEVAVQEQGRGISGEYPPRMVGSEERLSPRTEAIGQNYNLKEANLVSGMSLDSRGWEKVLLQPIED